MKSTHLPYKRIVRAIYLSGLAILISSFLCQRVSADMLTSQDSITVKGRLLEMGTRKPLSQVNIYCFSPAASEVPLKAVTDNQGYFLLQVQKGEVRWKVSLANYRVLEQSELVSTGVDKQFYLEKESYLVYETTVFGQGEKRDDKTKTLTQDQFLTLPGANGDPVKAVQNLPGVNRGNAFGSQIIIEGSSPQDTAYSIDTQSVPIIFHFSGLSSVVEPEAVDHVDYLSAGFGPEAGRTTAGLVNLYTKDPQTDRMHGFAFMDIFNLGGLVEGPINDHSSYLVGLRKSYIGAVLGQVAKGNSNFNLTVAPDFDDLVVEYKNRLSPTDSFKLVTVGSVDTLDFVLPEPADQEPSLRGDFSLNTSFYRFIPEYTHKYSADTVGHVWLGLGQDSTQQDFGSFYYHDVGWVLSDRVELESQMDDSWKSYFGLDNYNEWNKIDYQIPFSLSGQSGARTPLGVSTVQTVSNSYFLNNTGLYWRNVLHQVDSRWTYLPGLRIDYFNQSNDAVLEPRLAVREALGRGLTLRAATGLYSEAPPAQDFDSVYGNPDLKSQRAIHFTIGAEKDFRVDENGSGSNGWVASSDLFYKTLYNLVESTSTLNANGLPQYYNNDGTGRIYGAEFLLKYYSSKWTGWLAYTLSKSTRTYPPLAEQVFAYDQTHNIILIAQREFAKNWKFSGRVRYTTGDPYTPNIGGNFDADNDVYIPTSGSPFSSRYESFFQLDVRFDKKYIYDTWILTAYVDVENVTNHKNPQAIQYSYNYQSQQTVDGLPMLPTIGVKGEF